jgi:hypothetical protein
MTASFYLSGNPVHDRVIKALYEGCPDEKKLIEGFQYTPADVGVVFGVYKSKVPISYPRGEVYRRHRSDGADMVVLETGYIKRGDGLESYYAAGLNGLNGRADFKNANSPRDRFEALGIQVDPWREGGKHIVVCGQVPWDASVDGLGYEAWLQETLEDLSRLTTKPVRYREHPCIAPGSPLSFHLNNAWACVTLNSNSAVEAAIAGIPVFVADKGSMAWGIANLDIKDIEDPCFQDRTQWLNNLAYAQWTPAEMSSGLTWSHLFGVKNAIL